MSKTVRWGILGCGGIARKFATGLQSVPDAKLQAVGSRSQKKADAFGDEFDVPVRHAAYEALANDADVDVVYVATPHVFHHANTLLCLRAGRHVLCEKPFTINAREARELADAAGEHKRFLMEAMWTRFLPAVVEAERLMRSGAIGEVRMLQADFAFRGHWNPESRLLNPALGGGGLLDVGVYTVSLASLLLGTPETVTGCATIGETGVDEQAGMVSAHAGGALAVLACGVRTQTEHRAVIHGTEGRISLQPFWNAREVLLSSKQQSPEIVAPPFKGNGYNYQVEEVHACLAAGRLESQRMPLDESVAVMQTLDRLRQQWGLVYPSESKETAR